jgi:hypothetical protein
MHLVKRKLTEAKFFLDLLAKQTERENFENYLSAFLTACRSVSMIMLEEFKKIRDFEQWLKNELDSNPPMKFMQRKRNISVHQKPLHPHGQTNVSISESVSVSCSVVSIQLIDKDGNVVNSKASQTAPLSQPSSTEGINSDSDTNMSIQYLWYFDDYPSVDVLTLCKQFYDEAANLVSCCEIRYVS